jgi:transposase InsO family protein
MWCWDMTYLPAQVLRRRWFHLYLVLDLHSRKVVGWEVHDTHDSDHAVHLVQRTALAGGIAALPTNPVLHGDNGATLKATTVLAMLNCLGVKPSYSRPRVSDDNAYAESLFRTAKYRPEFPPKGFVDLDAARIWAVGFVRRYNHDHRHSGIRYVSPAQRHGGEDQAILTAQHELYTSARALNPARWSGATRNWSPIGPVTLNPERDSIINMLSNAQDTKPMAA